MNFPWYFTNVSRKFQETFQRISGRIDKSLKQKQKVRNILNKFFEKIFRFFLLSYRKTLQIHWWCYEICNWFLLSKSSLLKSIRPHPRCFGCGSLRRNFVKILKTIRKNFAWMEKNVTLNLKIILVDCTEMLKKHTKKVELIVDKIIILKYFLRTCLSKIYWNFVYKLGNYAEYLKSHSIRMKKLIHHLTRFYVKNL